ncbi:MAG: hypothetical protein AABW65_01210 [Nanoarchaeota archaeon]
MRKNPYLSMNIYELRKVIVDKNYTGLTVKDLQFEDSDLLSTLKYRKTEGISFLNAFYEEGLLKRLRLPFGYYKNLKPKEVIKLVERDFKGCTISEISEIRPGLVTYLRNTKLKGRKNLVNILIENGTLNDGTKSRSLSIRGTHRTRHGKNWNSLNCGYKNPAEYLKDYAKMY